MAVLQITERAPLVADVPGGFGENIGIQLAGIRIIVGVIAVLQQFGSDGFSIDQTSEVVGLELLHGIAGYGFETVARVVDIGHHTEEILVEALLANQVVLLHPVEIVFVKSEL